MRTIQVVGVAFVFSLSAGAAPKKGPRTADLKAVYVTSAGGVQSGGTSQIQVRLSPNTERVASVGVMEEFAGGTGDQWRTSLWQAAMVATQATQTSLLDYEFMLRVGGRIDGPSAGLLTAATLTALIRGKKVRPNTTMTGSINPDGSSGPVGGILYKLRGAAADGIKRFGFPLGGRQQTDASGTSVDLLAEAAKLGLEARELQSLDEAYTFLTGDTLPRPKPLAESDLELTPAELAALVRLDERVHGEVEAVRPEFNLMLKGFNEAAVRSYMNFVDTPFQKADQAKARGEAVAAVFERTTTLNNALESLQTARLYEAFRSTDLGPVAATVEASEAAVGIEEANFRKEIDAQFPPTTRVNDLFAMDLLESVMDTRVTLRLSQPDATRINALLAKKNLSPEEKVTLARATVSYAAKLLSARNELKNGQRFLSMYASLPAPKKKKRGLDAVNTSGALTSAGAASRSYFEALVTAPFAEATGVSQAQVQGGLVRRDSFYVDLLGYGAELQAEKDPRARVVTALRQALNGAYLTNTYYALGGDRTEKGVLTVRHPRALTVQHELAHRRVLESCGRAQREAGFIPLASKIRFLHARSVREGSDDEKLSGLYELWLANAWCEFAATR